MAWIAERDGALQLSVWARPRASKTSIEGTHGDALALRIAAPPVDGAANAELVKFIAKLLGVSKRDVEVAKGMSGRTKTLLISNVGLEEARRKLTEAGA